MKVSPHNNFKQKLHDKNPLIGTFVKTPSIIMAEVLSLTPFDVVCLDTEHSPYDRKDINDCLLAYRCSSMPSLVRIPRANKEYILNALDCGATGVVVPHVTSPELAEMCARSSKYGENGRGYAGSTRSAYYTTQNIEKNLAENLSENVVIAQIEDISAVDCIEEISSVAGIDCLFIGMMDLTVALRAKTMNDVKVVTSAEKICSSAMKYDKPIGMFVSSVDAIPFWRERGVSLFLMSSDHSFVLQGATQLVNQAKTKFG